MRLDEREIELLEGMIEVQLNHAGRCELMENIMAKRQRVKDIERAELLARILGPSIIEREG